MLEIEEKKQEHEREGEDTKKLCGSACVTINPK